MVFIAIKVISWYRIFVSSRGFFLHETTICIIILYVYLYIHITNDTLYRTEDTLILREKEKMIRHIPLFFFFLSFKLGTGVSIPYAEKKGA